MKVWWEQGFVPWVCGVLMAGFLPVLPPPGTILTPLTLPAGVGVLIAGATFMALPLARTRGNQSLCQWLWEERLRISSFYVGVGMIVVMFLWQLSLRQ